MYCQKVLPVVLLRNCLQFYIHKHISLPTSILQQTCYLSLAKMANSAQWKSEKDKILNMSLEDKRKLYKDYVSLNSVETWPVYALKNSVATKTKPTAEDLSEFKKINSNATLNKVLSSKVSIFRGDITKLEIDAIVNAANSRLKAGGGVDGAIHRAAGALLQEECNTQGGCPTGYAKVTGGYNLPAKYVVHTVGPQDGSAPILKSCYSQCLAYQREFNIKSIAFPCISTGIYGFPNRLAAHIALGTVRKFLEDQSDAMDRVIFCTFMAVDVDIYETLLQLYFPLE